MSTRVNRFCRCRSRDRECSVGIRFPGVLVSPVLDNDIGRAGQPLHVLVQLRQCRSGEVFEPIGGWVTERVEQSVGDQNGNLMGAESQVPSRFLGSQPCRSRLQVQKLFPLRVHGLKPQCPAHDGSFDVPAPLPSATRPPPAGSARRWPVQPCPDCVGGIGQMPRVAHGPRGCWP